MKRNIPVSIRIAGLVTILVVLAIGFSLTGVGIDKAHAVSSISIPKAWGPVKDVEGSYVILEDSGGVIRFVARQSGRVEETITRN